MVKKNQITTPAFSYRNKLFFLFLMSLLPVIFLTFTTYWLVPVGNKQLLSFILLGLATLLLTFLYYSMRHPLEDLKIVLMELSKGNYSARMKEQKNELGLIATSFNRYARLLDDFWNEINRLRQQINDSFLAIGQEAQKLQDQTDLQMSTTRQIGVNLKDLLIVVQTLEDDLNRASMSATATERLAVMGEQGLYQMEMIMKDMLAAASQIVKTLSELEEEVSSINKVIITIVKIADQSNLLSLNTAIRARKSGIEGQGFTVIAYRIREMADQIALATLDIEKVVQEIIKAVKLASEAVNLFASETRLQSDETKLISAQVKKMMTDTQEQLKRFQTIKEETDEQIKQISNSLSLSEKLKKESSHSYLIANKVALNTQNIETF